jgi:hypothetical protein
MKWDEVRKGSGSFRLIARFLVAIIFVPFTLPVNAAVVAPCNEAGLRAAIAQGGTVTFGCSGAIVLSNSIVISQDVILDGTGQSVTISGNNTVRLFQIVPGVTFTVRALALVSGRTNRGAAIYNDGGNVRLANCTLENHIAAGSTGEAALGGAIFNRTGGVTIVSCIFSNNQARGGAGRAATPPIVTPGGAAQGGAIYDELGRVSVTNCQFTANTAIGGEGAAGDLFAMPQSGGLSLGGSIYGLGTAVQITDAIFHANRAGGGSGGTVMITGQTPGAGGSAGGGAVALVANAQIMIANCRFTDNTALGGNGANGGGAFAGAMNVEYSQSEITKSHFSGNTVIGGIGARLYRGGPAMAGAVHTSGIANFSDCEFLQNSAAAGAGQQENSPSAHSQGGALFINSTSTLARVLVASNACRAAAASTRPQTGPGGSGTGGGVHNGGPLTILECAFVGNLATGGPGMLKEGFGSPAFSPGGDGSGGAIYNAWSIRVLNTTFARNTAAGGPGGVSTLPPAAGPAGAQYGGAVFNYIGSGELVNCTFAENSGQGGAVNAAWALTLKNSIVALSTSGNNCAGAVADGGNNISSDGSCGFSNASSRNNIDPSLAPLGNNGGPTPTMALRVNSPAVDTGNDAIAPATDQRGVSRPQGPHVDIGAFEALTDELRARLRIEIVGDADLAIHLWGRASTPFRFEASGNLKDWTRLTHKRHRSVRSYHAYPAAPRAPAVLPGTRVLTSSTSWIRLSRRE